MHTQSTDVLVAGAGPVGLAAALFLREKGLNVVVAEGKPAGVTHSYGLALHPATLELLESTGVVPDILARSRRVGSVAVYVGGSRHAVLPVAMPGARHGEIAIVGQEVLEAALGRILHQLYVPIWWNHRVARFDQEAPGVNVELDELEDRTTGYAVARIDRLVARTRRVAAQFLVGADGHGSLVRRQLEVDFFEVGPAQHVAVFEFETADQLPDEIALVLHDDGMGVLWPLPGGRARWSFVVDPAKYPVALREKDHDPVQMVAHGLYPALEEESFARLLKERAPWFPKNIRHIYWRMMVRFERRLAASFGRGRVWLAGDAAHLTGPVGIQSMNVGFQEASRLAGAIAASVGQGESGPLAAYDQACLLHWQHLHGRADNVAALPDALPEIARRKDELLSCLPGTGRELVMMANRLGLQINPGAFAVAPAPVGG